MNKRLYIKNVKGRGRGVFCKDAIAKGEIFDKCPVIVLPSSDFETAISSRLADYFFNFNKDENTLALALGFGSLYNHMQYCNAAYQLDPGARVMEYYALEGIPPGTEICINYAGEYGKECKAWFESRNIVPS